MKKLALIAGLLLASSPVAAQSRQQPLGAGGQVNNSQLPNTGVICIEEMTATFCNVPTGPNTAGYGSRGGTGSGTGSSSGSASSSGSGSSGGAGGAGTTASSTPPCSAFPPPNELCN
jgi:hypothetical protein